LPGGSNYEIPSFEELGINIKGLLASESNSNNIETSTARGDKLHASSSASNAAGLAAGSKTSGDYHNPKLKSTVYKKLREKVSKARVMWFAVPPERKPMGVIFEYAGVDLGHSQILDEVNKYLGEIGGHVEGLEFVPRTVHCNSVNVENMWILTLSDMNTKFYAITNGLMIKNHKVPVKSYDEFIFGEYEKFIRNEKYKQLIKNHEKAVEKSQKKKSINS
jgi:hypothetical protein